MEHEKVITEYLEWLMNRVGLEKDGDDGYLYFCRKLQSSDFVPVVDRDGNRCSECLSLRGDFATEVYDTEEALDILDAELCENGTILELLIVLAEKMRYEMSDSEFEASTRKWFIELLVNSGLDFYAKNKDFLEHDGERGMEDILYTIVFREIGWDGEGGLFPLFMPQRDQRRAELINQMNDYIEENYDI